MTSGSPLIRACASKSPGWKMRRRRRAVRISVTGAEYRALVARPRSARAVLRRSTLRRRRGEPGGHQRRDDPVAARIEMDEVEVDRGLGFERGGCIDEQDAAV